MQDFFIPVQGFLYLCKTALDEDFLANVSQRICYRPGCHLAPLKYHKNKNKSLAGDFEPLLHQGFSLFNFRTL